MTRELHELLKEASEHFASKAAVARHAGMAARTARRWINRDLQDTYVTHEEDAHYEENLRQSLPGAADSAPPKQPDTVRISGSTPEDEFDPETVISEQARRFRKKKHRATTKRQQTIRFQTGPVLIAFVGDQHIGNQGTDIERIFEEQRIINSTPRAYCWQMGDVVDNFIVGRLQAQNMKPSAPIWEQWQLAEHYLEGFDDRLLAFVGGNHGAWALQQTQIDYRRDICPDGVLYDGDEVKAEVSVGAANYRIWSRHKWRGSSMYNQTHGPERAARFNDPNFNLYVGAHNHTGSVFREFIHEGRRKAAVQIGTYKVHDDYQKKVGFAEHDASTACGVVLHDDGSFFGAADLTALSRYMKEACR